MAVEQVVEEVVEEVALNLEEAAAATRRLDVKAVTFSLGGLCVGVAIGFYFGYRYNREKIKAEAFAESELEIDKMRQHYEMRVAATKAEAEKPNIEDLVAERGYEVVEERPLKPPVPVTDKPVHKVHYAGQAGEADTLFPKRTADAEKSKDDGWNNAYELSRRNPERPFIIHQDEFTRNDSGYPQVTFSYYAGDDVYVDENEQVIGNVDEIIGLLNLTRWGHGADDMNVLYIRNTRLELEIELCRTPQSYEQDVLGLDGGNNEDDDEND